MPTTVPPSLVKAQELAALLGSTMSDDDEESEGSDDTDEGAMMQGGKGKSQAGNKRKVRLAAWHACFPKRSMAA